MSTTHINQIFSELSSRVLDITFKDENNLPFVPTAVYATLYDADSGTIINGRDHQNIHNVNGGTFNANVLSLQLEMADFAIVNPARGREKHVLLIEAEWGDGFGEKIQVIHSVDNFAEVP